MKIERTPQKGVSNLKKNHFRVEVFRREDDFISVSMDLSLERSLFSVLNTKAFYKYFNLRDLVFLCEKWALFLVFIERNWFIYVKR